MNGLKSLQLHPNWPSPKLLEYCKEKGIHATAYSCLGSTDSPLLSGKDETLLNIAKTKDKTPAQVLYVSEVQRKNNTFEYH